MAFLKGGHRIYGVALPALSNLLQRRRTHISTKHLINGMLGVAGGTPTTGVVAPHNLIQLFLHCGR